MSTDPRYKMSAAHKQKLIEELENLQTVRALEVSEQIKEARSYGDLTENSEYDEAKTEEVKLYQKIAELKDLVENAEIIDYDSESGNTKVAIGCRVTIREIGGFEDEEYQIVASQEADPRNSRISEESPIGRALMGRETGDEIQIHAPAGVLYFTIQDIKF